MQILSSKPVDAFIAHVLEHCLEAWSSCATGRQLHAAMSAPLGPAGLARSTGFITLPEPPAGAQYGTCYIFAPTPIDPEVLRSI